MSLIVKLLTRFFLLNKMAGFVADKGAVWINDNL